MNEVFMRLALEEADNALKKGEVPVGAVVVNKGKVIASSHNAPISTSDPCAHAEILALRKAAKYLDNYRLEDCDIYVTLEPCAMCAGAILHSRIKNLIFGANDFKTGAAGSTINLFNYKQLNHQTQVTGGVLEVECSAILKCFFQNTRELNKIRSKPLRQDALRTPESAFLNLPNYPWKSNYVDDLNSLDGLRMHYLDEGNNDSKLTYLCLHGNPTWSYLYRHMIPVFLSSGARVVAPDLIGFGKSDKPKKDSFHTFLKHRLILLEFIEKLDLRNIVFVVQDWGGILGLTLPMVSPGRYLGLLAMNTLIATGVNPLPDGFTQWREMCKEKPNFDISRLLSRSNPTLTRAECDAYQAPFPDQGHRASTRAFPQILPDSPNSVGADISKQAELFWKNDWIGLSMIGIGIKDPVFGERVMQQLHHQIRGSVEIRLLPQASHFVPESGYSLALDAVDFFNSEL